MSHPNLAVDVLVACALVFPWVILPLRMRKTHWVSVDARFEPFDPERDDVPTRAAEVLQEIVPDLERLGFRCLGHFRVEGTVANADACVTLFENRRTRQTARRLTTIVEKSRNPQLRQGVTSLIFYTEFTDGSRLVTSNTAQRSIQPIRRNRPESMSFPWIQDPVRLYAIHDACVARYAGDGIRVAPTISDPAEYLRTSRNDEVARFVESGYYQRDEASGRYRSTWKGAYLMTWKLLWPVKPVRHLLRDYWAARMLRELGLDGPTNRA
jgi:hypothetical protein